MVPTTQWCAKGTFSCTVQSFGARSSLSCREPSSWLTTGGITRRPSPKARTEAGLQAGRMINSPPPQRCWRLPPGPWGTKPQVW